MPNPGDGLGKFGTWITPRLATGGTLNGDPANVEILHAAGITTVIDCQIETDDSGLLASAPFQYLWNGVADDGQPKPEGWFARSLTFALPFLALPDHRIYAHCAAGVNRGPSTLYAVMRAVGFPPDEAMRLLMTARPIVQVRYAVDADRAVEALGYE